MCRAWHGLHSSISHRIVTSFIVHSSHCIAPHRIATWCIASILFVCIAYRFVQYGNAKHWIASPRPALYRPRTASLVHHILSHRIASLCLTSYRFALRSHRIASYPIRTVWQRSALDRIASHRIIPPTHSIASHRIASHRIAYHCPCIASYHTARKSIHLVDATTRTKMSHCSSTSPPVLEAFPNPSLLASAGLWRRADLFIGHNYIWP